MQVMFRIVQRGTSLPQSKNQLCQTVGPQPGRLDGLVLLPTCLVVSPDFEAARIPIVSQEICVAVSPIDFQAGAAVALDGVTGNNPGKRAVLVPQDHVGDILARLLN